METLSSELWTQCQPDTDESDSRILASLPDRQTQDAGIGFDSGHQDADGKIQVGLDDDTKEPAEPQPVVHTYLRAIHFFDPSADPATDMDEDTITVVIFPRDLILVHSIHENGWTDGTILASGKRGWLPTTYCEAYDHPLARPLLTATSQFWDLLEDEGNENAAIGLVRQSYVTELRRGTRYLLERTGCLHRDSALVQQDAKIRRVRKKLLADLASMIQKASELLEKASQPQDSQAVDNVSEALDNLVTKIFKMVTRAAHFVDVWTQDASNQLDRSPSLGSEAAVMSPHDLSTGTMPIATPEPSTQDRQLDVEYVRSDDQSDDEKRSLHFTSHSESRKQPSPLVDTAEKPYVPRESDFLPNTDPHRAECISSPRPVVPEPPITKHEFCKPFPVFPEKTCALESGIDQREDLRDNFAEARRCFAWIVFYFTLAMSLSIVLFLVWLFAWRHTTDILGPKLSPSRSPYSQFT